MRGRLPRLPFGAFSSAGSLAGSFLTSTGSGFSVGAVSLGSAFSALGALVFCFFGFAVFLMSGWST